MLAVLLLLEFPAIAWSAPAQREIPQVERELRTLLDPLLGDGAYRLAVTVPAAGEGLRVVLVVDSAEPAAGEHNREALSALVSASAGLDARRGDVLLLSALPFEGRSRPWLENWNADRVLALSLLLLAVAVLLKLSARLGRSLRARGGWRALWPTRRPAPDYQRELMAVRSIAMDDPARVAQVLRQWINSNEQ